MRKPGSNRDVTFRKIRAAGVDLFYQHGYEAVTTKALARAAGIEEGTLYYHIRSKQDLLFRIMKDSIEDTLAGMDSALDGFADPESEMLAFIRYYLQSSLLHKKEGFLGWMEMRSLTPANRKVVVRLMRILLDRLRRIIKQGAAAGRFHVRDLSITTTTIILMLNANRLEAQMRGVMRWFDPAGRLNIEQVTNIQSALILAALRGGQYRRSETPGVRQASHGVGNRTAPRPLSGRRVAAPALQKVPH